MSDFPLPNMPGRITASAEMLEAAVPEPLRRMPDTWEVYKPDDLSEGQRFEIAHGSETNKSVNWARAVYERVREFG